MKERKELERLEKKWATKKATKAEMLQAMELRRKLKKLEVKP